MTNLPNISLHLKELYIGYRPEAPLIRRLNLELKSGLFTGLVGNNGTGKSTLLKTLCGLIAPLSGTVLLEGQNMLQNSSKELAQLVSVVLTDRIEGFDFSVWELVSTGRYPHTGYFGKMTTSDEGIVEHYILSCGIQHIRNKSINAISDGERQKAMIARALAQQTPVMLLDEPTAFLDYASKKSITLLLKEMARKENKIILLSSHDLDILLKNADTILYLESGHCTLRQPGELIKQLLV